MSVQKRRATKKNSQIKPNGKISISRPSGREIVSYDSAETGIASANHMGAAIDEIYRHAASGEAVSASQQAHVMLNAVGKMLALENLKFRVGQYAEKHGTGGRSFFLGDGNHAAK